MFHKIKNVSPLPEYKLSVQFAEGVTKIYDVKPLFQKIPAFKSLESGNDFGVVYVDVGGYGIIWNDELDLSCDELWENGVDVCKFGKQWVVSIDAMKREYGNITNR